MAATQKADSQRVATKGYFTISLENTSKDSEKVKMPSDLATIIVRNAPPEARSSLRRILITE